MLQQLFDLGTLHGVALTVAACMALLFWFFTGLSELTEPDDKPALRRFAPALSFVVFIAFALHWAIGIPW